jgi:UPF0755 protein
MSYGRLWLKALGTLSLCVVLLFAIFTTWLFLPIHIGREKSIKVYLGSTASDVLNEIALLNVHRPVWLFKLCMSVFGVDKNLKAGIYDLPERLSRFRLLMILRQRKPRFIHATIPPGLMSHEIARKLEELQLADGKRLIMLVEKPPTQLRKPWLEDGKSLEGFLFPETYYFPPLRPGRDESYIISAMLNEFERQFIKPNEEKLKKCSYSLYELVTLASMVEWEAKVDDERPIIAGVLINRLKLGMPLQCDPTIFYALKQRKRRITYSDLQLDSPYNTYKHSGLPPTPVCNPSLKSLLAVLEPAKVDYLYYVACGGGRHKFSKTYEEHMLAVRQWRKLQSSSNTTKANR